MYLHYQLTLNLTLLTQNTYQPLTNHSVMAAAYGHINLSVSPASNKFQFLTLQTGDVLEVKDIVCL